MSEFVYHIGMVDAQSIFVQDSVEAYGTDIQIGEILIEGLPSFAIRDLFTLLEQHLQNEQTVTQSQATKEITL